MLNPSFKELGEKGDSRYTLSILVAKRARAIIDGAEPLVDVQEHDNPVTIALREVLEDKISYDREDKVSLK